ncbi:hypothetical protein KI688_002305 [Linnemannia hyalina]|uniref:Uncharacterized protein n=1 Tax=Linnemannia hyalina TaxID=64524 RepID=A0A9P7XPV9_9FUNG|nr:hypothetical protein KI688_002305 [Linnemannia hyalina]
MASPVAASPSQERVLHIPELLEAIGSHMVVRGLLASSWSEFFIATLWNTIGASLYAWLRILRGSENYRYPLNEDWLQCIFAKYGKHIRHLTIRWRILIGIAYLDRACTDLFNIRIMDIKQYRTYNLKDHREPNQVLNPSGFYVRRFPTQRHSHWVTGIVLIPELEGVFGPTAILLKSEERQKRD